MAQARLGDRAGGWTAPVRPGPKKIAGHYVELEVLSAQKHAADLFQSFLGHDNIWDYMPSGPFNSSSQFYRWVSEMTQSDDSLFYAIRNLSSRKWEGIMLSENSAECWGIEVGHISFSPALQRTTAATEAIFLMMCWVFETGYRRFEWKCNALNAPSRRAAQRLGFSYEGIFRQATVIKGRNRDTAWFAMIDKEWPPSKRPLMSGCPHAILIRAACKRKNLATSQVWPESHQIRRFKRLVSGQAGFQSRQKLGFFVPFQGGQHFLIACNGTDAFLETGSRIFGLNIWHIQ